MDDENSNEAALRGAASTAYYALFHLLIRDLTADRPLFGRIFGHGKMKAACYKLDGVALKSGTKRREVPFEHRAAVDHLRVVGQVFVQAQETREFADYDLSRV